MDLSFFKNKRIFITGHTGFKGSWLCKMLHDAGAVVIGYALNPPTQPNLFDILNMEHKINSYTGDVRDFNKLQTIFRKANPELVIHMAAQPIVRESYLNPVYTYETNVMGTVNILECVRQAGNVGSFLNVTTDKVYLNQEWVWGYRETDNLDGYDPYSNSKSCSELVTASYKRSFLNGITPISTARAGNVIGGGDFAADRIIPDCVRAMSSGKQIIVRNPDSTRPYQHVLEPLSAYLMILKEQYQDSDKAGCYNVGPDDCGCVKTGTLVELFCRFWGQDAGWSSQSDRGPHEAGCLKLDCSKIKKVFSWQPKWKIDTAVQKTVEWTKAFINRQDYEGCMERQIEDYLK